MLELLNGNSGLIAAIAALFAGIAALITAIIKVIEIIRKWKKNREEKMILKNKSVIKIFSIGLIFISFSAGIFAARYFTQDRLAVNAKLTQMAWDSFNKDDYRKTIDYAEKCINEFKGSADREQKELEDLKTPQPPKGSVSEQDKEIILKRGLLNDVATCFFIKGYSYEKLNQTDEAKKAYSSASFYTYARCWDPNGFFWIPAEAAKDRMSQLK